MKKNIVLGNMEFDSKLMKCRRVADVFELVKEETFKLLGQDRAGLLVGLSDLGRSEKGVVSAYYSPHSNMIIINSRLLAQVTANTPEYANHYLFHVILHEYIHSLGFLDEETTRLMTEQIAQELGNPEIIQLAKSVASLFPEIAESRYNEPPEDRNIYFATGIDRRNTNYIG